ncbi:MAG TPA: DUF1080 domain-containing protein [Mariniphaga anaerophila]|uniref:DUF1080 domain-containing protein n=1 Tax=Mariniphaga anaerophila TaxID=1484053 RepID=A0A831LWA2_9BACT|nr:DUF1080 domain-containing protein [Mariniphaga anaerophila]
MKKYFLFVITASVFAFYSCQTEKPWQPLFNGENLENWDMYLGTPLTGFEDLAEAATTNKVFSVVEENGEKLIRITGEVNGSLATRDTFANYHLQLVFKWGTEVYTNRNSGLLYHSFGDFGEALGTWMVNIECQLMHNRLGDTYLMNNTYCETAVKETDGAFFYASDGEVKQFSKEHNGPLVNKAFDAENPLGEWNTVDLYCFGRTAVHVVNGQTVMVNNNTGTVENGTIVPLTGGKIQLQAEGGELFIKTIQVKPIKEIPAEVLP